MKSKLFIVAFACMAATHLQAQDKDKQEIKVKKTVVTIPDTLKSTFARGTVYGALSLGFVDQLRANYKGNSTWTKGTITGFTPIYGRLEYGITKNLGLGVAFIYDAFQVNIYQTIEENNKKYIRTRTDKVTGFSGNIYLSRHFTTHIPKTAFFVAAGLGTNRVNHTNMPQGDSTTDKKEYGLAPFLRAGAQYYFSSRASALVDAGYDGKAIVTLGVACRFGRNK